MNEYFLNIILTKIMCKLTVFYNIIIKKKKKKNSKQLFFVVTFFGKKTTIKRFINIYIYFFSIFICIYIFFVIFSFNSLIFWNLHYLLLFISKILFYIFAFNSSKFVVLYYLLFTLLSSIIVLQKILDLVSINCLIISILIYKWSLLIKQLEFLYKYIVLWRILFKHILIKFGGYNF